MTGFINVTNKIKETLELDVFVNTVTCGSIFRIDLNKLSIYPISHIQVNSVQSVGYANRFNISLISMDLVGLSKDENTNDFVGNNNEQYVLNTQLAVQMRVVELLQRSSIVTDNYCLVGEANYEMFTDRFDADVAGWVCTFDIDVPKDMTIA